MQDDLPSLATLLADYAALLAAGVPSDIPSPLTPSPLSPAKVDQLEADLGLTLPADYRALALTYDLGVIAVYFSRFHPTFKRDLLDALRFAFRDPANPDMSEGYATWSRYAQEYRAWGVIPVGDDFLQRELVLTVRGCAPLATDARIERHVIPYREMAAIARPVGSVWAFQPSNHAGGFTFVSSTFTQALWSALYLRVRLRPSPDDDPLMDPDAALATLATHDPAIVGAPYWRTWARLMARD